MMYCPDCQGLRYTKVGCTPIADCKTCCAQGKLALGRFIELVRIRKCTLFCMFREGWTPEQVYKVFQPSAHTVKPLSYPPYKPPAYRYNGIVLGKTLSKQAKNDAVQP